MIEICAARPSHVGTIASRMRDIDALECRLVGYTPKHALRAGLNTGASVWTAKVDGRPEAMFGVSTISTIEGRGRIWLLMTDVAAKHHKALVRFGAIYTAAFHRHYSVLENYVHADNDLAIRWLTRLGYVIEPVDVINGCKMRGFYSRADAAHRTSMSRRSKS